MVKEAWHAYILYAKGQNELKPMSKRGHSAMIFGKTPLGATIVDSLDTLYLMGLMEEFDEGRHWVELSLQFDRVRECVGEGGGVLVRERGIEGMRGVLVRERGREEGRGVHGRGGVGWERGREGGEGLSRPYWDGLHSSMKEALPSLLCVHVCVALCKGNVSSLTLIVLYCFSEDFLQHWEGRVVLTVIIF